MTFNIVINSWLHCFMDNLIRIAHNLQSQSPRPHVLIDDHGEVRQQLVASHYLDLTLM